MINKEDVICAFAQAEERGYISKNSSEDEVIKNAYEILEFAPFDASNLSPDDYETAIDIMIDQLN